MTEVMQVREAYRVEQWRQLSLADIWRIDFFTLNRNEQGQLVPTPGDCQSVYLNSDGITQLIVYGE